MVVSNFTVPELKYLRDNCNFVGVETHVFELRSRGIPLEEIAETLNMSAEGIKKVSRKVNSKIKRVL
jgi:transcriptional regulator